MIYILRKYSNHGRRYFSACLLDHCQVMLNSLQATGWCFLELAGGAFKNARPEPTQQSNPTAPPLISSVHGMSGSPESTYGSHRTAINSPNACSPRRPGPALGRAIDLSSMGGLVTEAKMTSPSCPWSRLLLNLGKTTNHKPCSVTRRNSRRPVGRPSNVRSSDPQCRRYIPEAVQIRRPKPTCSWKLICLTNNTLSPPFST
ncbi:hypothetical protein BDM02DRAFT_3016746 [Thelephora ganbajun]|uniref:Uncharacterized protein n=1 Tax=Thelephora ganbajun TaxID=370292 RepID=A0ACB6ZAD8_THEGA|nr:hypothetical protein BDM02DRAFT_3016746 [Thelephora ganbajun]